MTILRENTKMQPNNVSLADRLIATGSYLTLGLVGMVWLILNYLVVKKPMSKFLAYNVVQSFVLSILYAIFTSLYNIFIGILVGIPFVGKLFLFIHNFLFETPIFHTMNFVNFVTLILLLYLSLFAIFAYLPYVPFVTNIAKSVYK